MIIERIKISIAGLVCMLVLTVVTGCNADSNAQSDQAEGAVSSRVASARFSCKSRVEPPPKKRLEESEDTLV